MTIGEEEEGSGKGKRGNRTFEDLNQELPGTKEAKKRLVEENSGNISREEVALA